MAVVANGEVVEWTGWLGRQARPTTEADARRVVNVIFIMYVFSASSVLPLAFGWITVEGAASRGELTTATVPSFLALGYFWWLLRRPSERFLALVPATSLVAYAVAIVGISRGLSLVGPALGVVVVFYVEAPLVSFYILRFRWAVFWTALMMLAYAVGLGAVDGVEAPVAHWILVFSAAVVSGYLVGGLAVTLHDARTQLNAINGRLRRFLAPQVADAVVAEGDELAPHKREIAVFFVDLRGFTAFTNAVSPDRVVEVLSEYYAVVGSVVHRYGGTIGGFDGDGVFAFLGDPVPNENAAADALNMAKEVATQLDAHTAEWSLGYGIGLAYGEVTVGLVGFEGRLDYTPVGACVNLAARLCSEAKPGEILVDEALREAAQLRQLRRRKAVELKGFGEVSIYAVRH